MTTEVLVTGTQKRVCLNNHFSQLEVPFFYGYLFSKKKEALA